MTLALDTTLFLGQETEYMPWQAALNNLDYFKLMFDRSEVFGVMTVSGVTSLALQQDEGEAGQGGCCFRGCWRLTVLLFPRNTSRTR